ncbi:hypothetical protein M409DRAFT_38329 [Zasmidium cellare ATCC 36951]|uniref:Thioesterase TesA-like domain-containing protein n=1 Tax=Zasmidium cellare ATCC 36951 TaxID=1080233 RepID=A0A6A6BUF3_ZASCE|nr:uncharacterized protein M409DRAFT_38329 [Zasmidium cellare ATCC 36951]KAF2158325.1 hypothetical protein M409DRAFT_38329 [Zasmidium cellare ATCC 36951]
MSAHLECIEVSDQDSTALPLVLVHDGGGTVFQYFLLGPFYRQVYAISSPYFRGGGKPEGGIPQLAKEYARAIQAELGQGNIILGAGWSFGGMLSIEVARLLRQSGRIGVQGLLMIDSICPWSSNYKSRGRVRPTYRKNTSDAVKAKVNRSFDNARDLLHEWARPPTFEAPPAVMIQASDALTRQNLPDGEQDLEDQDGQLGWSEYPCLHFVSVVTVPGDHFSMFADDKVRLI